MQDGTDLTPEPSDADHVAGSLEAPVIITEFADYECPYCGEAYPVIEAIREKYGSRVAYVFRNYPLPMHSHALAAAEAAEAASSVGKFWEMHRALFEHQKALTNADLAMYAKSAGVDATIVAQAIANETYREKILADVESGNESSIDGTPAIFINGFFFDGNVSVDELSEFIDRALAAV